MTAGPRPTPTRAELLSVLTRHYRMPEAGVIAWLRRFVCEKEKR